MALINCPECKQEMSSQAQTCQNCGFTVSENISLNAASCNDNSEVIIAEYKYTMMAAAPLWFLIFCGLIFVYGLGIILFIVWLLIKLPAPKLIITNKAVIYRQITEKRIEIANIEKIRYGASLPQKILMRSGWIAIYKKSWIKIPLVINGLPDPEKIKRTILQQTS